LAALEGERMGEWGAPAVVAAFWRGVPDSETDVAWGEASSAAAAGGGTLAGGAGAACTGGVLGSGRGGVPVGRAVGNSTWPCDWMGAVATMADVAASMPVAVSVVAGGDRGVWGAW
jgi:hypothetical protein